MVVKDPSRGYAGSVREVGPINGGATRQRVVTIACLVGTADIAEPDNQLTGQCGCSFRNRSGEEDGFVEPGIIEAVGCRNFN